MSAYTHTHTHTHTDTHLSRKQLLREHLSAYTDTLSQYTLQVTLQRLRPAATVCWHRWILGRGNLVHDTTTTMQGPCSEMSAPPREGSAAGVPPWGTLGPGGVRSVVFFPGRQVTRVPSYVRRPFRTGEYRKGMIPARPLYQCFRGSGDWFGIPNPRESGSVI